MSAIMPDSGHDRRLINLRPLLCCCSQGRAGLQSPVRTYLTPPTTVLPTPCTFFPCRTLGGGGMGNDPRTQYEPRPKPGTPLTPQLIRRGVLRTSTAITTPLTGATGQGRAPGVGGRIHKNDDHDLRHAPQRSATGKTNCSPPDQGGEVDALTDPHACNPTSLSL